VKVAKYIIRIPEFVVERPLRVKLLRYGDGIPSATVVKSKESYFEL